MTETNSRPLLSIVTRTHNRPKMLLRCIVSVSELETDDWEHVIIYDPKGTGIKNANSLFLEHKNRVRGEYVYILDDDDYLVHKTLIPELKQVVANKPGIVIVKMFSALRGHDLPDYWKERVARRGQIGSSCFIVRADLWHKYIDRFAGGACGDHRFLKAILDDKSVSVVWWNKRVAHIPKEHHGQGGG